MAKKQDLPIMGFEVGPSSPHPNLSLQMTWSQPTVWSQNTSKFFNRRKFANVWNFKFRGNLWCSDKQQLHCWTFYECRRHFYPFSLLQFVCIQTAYSILYLISVYSPIFQLLLNVISLLFKLLFKFRPITLFPQNQSSNHTGPPSISWICKTIWNYNFKK